MIYSQKWRKCIKINSFMNPTSSLTPETPLSSLIGISQSDVQTLASFSVVTMQELSTINADSHQKLQYLVQHLDSLIEKARMVMLFIS